MNSEVGQKHIYAGQHQLYNSFSGRLQHKTIFLLIFLIATILSRMIHISYNYEKNIAIFALFVLITSVKVENLLSKTLLEQLLANVNTFIY